MDFPNKNRSGQSVNNRLTVIKHWWRAISSYKSCT